MRVLVWLFRAFLFFTLFAFALNNSQEVVVHWFLGQSWRAPLVIVVNANSPYKDLAALMAAAKAAPKTINYATVGSGSATWSVRCWNRQPTFACRTCPTGAAHKP